MADAKQYAERDPMALDKAGGYYLRHVSAMTGEKLHSKADIAAELGWRDLQIADRDRRIEALTKALRELTFAARTSGGTAGRDEALCRACETAEEALAASGGAQGDGNG